MELFDVIKVMFEKPGEWTNVSDLDKKRHFFMVNRFMSINFPIQADLLQQKSINPVHVMDFWQKFLSKQYKRVPGWIYTKGAKKSKERAEKLKPVSDKIILKYCEVFKVEYKSVQDAMTLFPVEMNKELKQFEQNLKE